MSKSIDQLSIDTIRVLAADMVSAANSGHPGAPMGCAPMAHILFSRFVRTNGKSSHWFNRDRFVLSNGHACALQYVLLHLLGFKLTIDDLKNFRQLNSRTPGHPERDYTDGVEVSTGPLGQGFTNAVGLAIAGKHMAARFNKPGYELIANNIYVIAGDGCMQEGVASEAASLAGHLKLNNLICLYDDNKIQIDGTTELAFTEDVLKRFDAYGWNVLSVDGGDHDLDAITKALESAKKSDKPTLIRLRTTIGFGSSLAGTEKVHGAPLSKDDLVAVKKQFGFDPQTSFHVPEEVRKFYGDLQQKGAKAEAEWNKMFEEYRSKFKAEGEELTRRLDKKLPADWRKLLPTYTPSDAAVATRKLSEILLNKIADGLPELVGGSADLTHSNLTRWKSAVDFQHPSTNLGKYEGRYLRFGVREHAMAGISNGIHAYGGLIPFAATFLNFISYALGSVRLSALSHHQILYIMTHDSIGLGEDGPTHQPVETLAGLRATPNMYVWRPADGNEVSGAYAAMIEERKYPSVICLSRQNLPHLKGSSMEDTEKGGYVLNKDVTDPQIILIATGSEVSLIVDAAKELTEKDGLKVRLVSLPCWERFDAQSHEYRRSVIPAGVLSVAVEAYVMLGWERYSHVQIGLTTFGASAPAPKVYAKFGLVPDVVANKARVAYQHYKDHQLASFFDKPSILN